MKRPGKIICVGRNYAAHAKELGNAVPDKPLLFLKPPSSVIGENVPIVLPPESRQVEHEGEIGVVIGNRLWQGDEAAAPEGDRGDHLRPTTSRRATSRRPTSSSPAPRALTPSALLAHECSRWTPILTTTPSRYGAE